MNLLMSMAVMTDNTLGGDSMSVFRSGVDCVDLVDLNWGIVFFLVVVFHFLWDLVVCLVLNYCFERYCVVVMILAVGRHHESEQSKELKKSIHILVL